MASAVLGALVCGALSAAATARRQEGQDLVAELAEQVLANKQEILPIPWEFSIERDVGYVGEHPILENSTAEAKQESLGTVREIQDGLTPNIPVAAVAIKDLDQPPAPPSSFRTGGTVGGMDYMHLNGVVNPTADLTVWQWQRNKWFGLKKWLEFWISRYPEKLVVVHSYGDVLFGGCNETTLQYKYDSLVAASGSTTKIVLAAEVSPYPSDMGWAYQRWNESLVNRTHSVLDSYGMSHGWAETYANCSASVPNSQCSSPPRYQYANAGFIMGPANDVYEMLSGLSTYPGLENRLVNEYFLANPDVVTLDYPGTLVLSLHNMVKDGNTPVEVVTTGGNKSLRNKETGQSVCFVHGNGNSFDVIKGWAEQLTA